MLRLGKGSSSLGVAMTLPRRKFLRLMASTAVLSGISQMAGAQAYPSRPVHLIVPFTPGGTTDIVARLVGQWLSERLGKPIIVEDRPGAGTNVGTEVLVNAAPDGYTLLVASVASAVNATLYQNLNFNFRRDIAPIAGLIRTAYVMEVNRSVPVNTVPEFIAYAKANPAKINMASSGNGTGAHLSGELFNMMTGTNMIHVPYRGAAPALNDLIAGQVQVQFASAPETIEYIRSGKLRAIGVTTSTRLAALPEIQAIDEFVPGYETSAWWGLCAPKNTPAAIVERLSNETNAALADPTLKTRLATLGADPMVMGPAEFGKLIADETEKWAKVIKFAGIKPE
jgi:tripartite-type tricarboxylate transporter receptor subunit TctC